MNFILNQIILYLSILLVLFIPGRFLFSTIFGKTKKFHPVEKVVLYFGSSFAITNFLMLILGKLGIPLNRVSIIISIILLCAVFFGIYRLRISLGLFKKDPEETSHISFKKSQTISILIIIFLIILIKTVFLQNTIFPTSTDLGHHMYWSKFITETGNIPTYQESEIINENGLYKIGEPEKIADFIIGEHLVFSAIGMISGNDFVSAFPSLILFLINIFGILAVFILSIEIFKDNPHGINMAIAALFFIGPLYSLSSPQAKFVSGGVIGNTVGNFFIPLILYFLVRAFGDKSSVQMFMAFFSGLALAYTHHLSTFVFMFSIIFSLPIILVLFRKHLFLQAKQWLGMLFSPEVISMIVFGIVMIFFVYTPTYLNTSAIDTAVGTPIKSTRTGLSFSQLSSSSGDARMILGVLGLLSMLFLYKVKSYGKSFLLGWTLAIFTMSLWPRLLFVDIPSNRIANYISIPLSILSGFFIFFIFDSLRNKDRSAILIKPVYMIFIFSIFIIFSSTNGFFDNSSSLSKEGNNEKAVQTFESSKYLSGFIDSDDVILKDHNYIVADSWIKLFFMRDYNFPLSRAYFKRYEDETKEREQCTLLMISLPNSDDGKKCFSGTGTDFVMVNPAYDGAQFKKNRDFWQVYQSDDISIFHKSR